jgi:hypothetical protein
VIFQDFGCQIAIENYARTGRVTLKKIETVIVPWRVDAIRAELERRGISWWTYVDRSSARLLNNSETDISGLSVGAATNTYLACGCGVKELMRIGQGMGSGF